MRHLQDALLRAGLPKVALEGRPSGPLPSNQARRRRRAVPRRQKMQGGRRGRGRGVRRRHEGPDVLHLHGGPPLEDKGGPRARMRVPRDGGLCTRVVLGGAGEDFSRGGRGEQFGRPGDATEVGSMGLVWSVRAKVPRRGGVRARVGVLEDLRGPAGDGLRSESRDEPAWGRFRICKTRRGLVDSERGPVVYDTTTWRTSGPHSRPAGQSCAVLLTAWTERGGSTDVRSRILRALGALWRRKETPSPQQ